MQTFIVERMRTPVGAMLLVTDSRGCLRAFQWADQRDAMCRALNRQYREEIDLVPGRVDARVRRAISAYFDGELSAIESVAIATGGTAFQSDVWSSLRRIPVGKTISYATLAARIGRPAAVRAVGLANGSNPIAIVVPCHRVIGKDSTLTGYGGGLENKRWLLTHEGAYFKGAA